MLLYFSRPLNATMAQQILSTYEALGTSLHKIGISQVKPIRILLIEDDENIARSILHLLRNAGHLVDVCDEAFLYTHEFDLLIMSLDLPDLRSWATLPTLRAQGRDMPVLVLSTADNVENRVKTLDLGADAFMAKPFSLQELEARVRALTRRHTRAVDSVIKLGALSYDFDGRVAYIDDRVVRLTASELSLLEILIQRGGRVVSKDRLVEQLLDWGVKASHTAIETHIHRLRVKILSGSVRIATKRGFGYCLNKIVLNRK